MKPLRVTVLAVALAALAGCAPTHPSPAANKSASDAARTAGGGGGTQTWTVTAHRGYSVRNDCWRLEMRQFDAHDQFLRTCTTRADYRAHPVGSKYTTTDG